MFHQLADLGRTLDALVGPAAPCWRCPSAATRAMPLQTPLYLDHCASAPLLPEVAEALQRALALQLGNPSSVHGPGQQARGLVDAARRQVARVLSGQPRQVVLTSGATESNALALKGYFAKLLQDYRAGMRPAPRLLVFALEHPSIHAIAGQLVQQGVVVQVVQARPDGVLDLAALAQALAARPDALALQAVNQELGSLQPMAEAAVLCRQTGTWLHCDATQALPRLPVSVEMWPVDSLALSGHKLGTPPGIGALWLRQPGQVQALQPGHQEGGLRAGTESVLGAVALQAALAALPARLAAAAQVRQQRDQLWQQLADVPGIVRNGPLDPAQETGAVLSIALADLHAAELVLALDVEGVAVSAGSACASGTQQPSAVLLALGDGSPQAIARARGTLRLSLGPETSAHDITTAAKTIGQVVARLRS
jgi:cysteine desulfurase